MKNFVNILVVDDEEANLEVMDAILENFYRLNIFKALNAKEALEILKSNEIDIAFIDLMMPETSGQELIRHIKEDLKLKHIHIIVVSALNDDLTKKEVYEIGAEDYIEKPIDLDLINKKIKRILLDIGKGRDCRHYAKYSLFYGKYEPFFISFHIKCEYDLIRFSELLEFLGVNPVELTRFTNILHKNLDELKSLKFVIEKDIHYIYITSKVNLLKNRENIKKICRLDNDANVFTYRLHFADDVLFTKKQNALQSTQKQLDSEDFFDFDDAEEVDEFFDFGEDEGNAFMHNYEKIDAKTFIENSDISKDEIDEIKDLGEELESILYMHDLLNDEVKTKIIEIFTSYRNLCISFIEINNAMNELISILDEVDVNSIPEDSNRLILEFIKALQDDLSSWLNNVFIEQSAVDIHYLDASILSSILQIRTMLSDYVKSI